MSKAQLSVRSAKARDLAHALAKRNAQPICMHVEQTLERFEQELRELTTRSSTQVLWDLMAEGRRAVPAGTTSAHDDFYDEHSLPQRLLIDTPMNLAVALGEPEAEMFQSVIEQEHTIIGWPALLEAGMVLTGKQLPNAAAIINRTWSNGFLTLPRPLIAGLQDQETCFAV